MIVWGSRLLICLLLRESTLRGLCYSWSDFFYLETYNSRYWICSRQYKITKSASLSIEESTGLTKSSRHFRRVERLLIGRKKPVATFLSRNQCRLWKLQLQQLFVMVRGSWLLICYLLKKGTLSDLCFFLPQHSIILTRIADSSPLNSKIELTRSSSLTFIERSKSQGLR